MDPKKDDVFAIDLNYFMVKKEFFDKIKSSDLSYNQAKEFIQKEKAIDGNVNSQIMSVQSNKGVIKITGELVNQKDPCAAFFGYAQTKYSDIVSAINSFAGDDSVDEIVLAINSPGGAVAGLLDTMNVINAVEKPITSIVGDMCCSAAYFLASQTNKITANNKLSTIGSVGIMAPFIDNKEAMQKAGLKKIIITSTDAPDKYVDIATQKGQDDIRGRIDEIHKIFVAEVSKGRNKNVDDINSNFGKGGVMLAEKAKEVGMIDEVNNLTKSTDSKNKNISSKVSETVKIEADIDSSDKNKQEVKDMDLKTLKSEHPALYSEVLEIGMKAERSRIEGLNAWVKSHPATSDVVERAISQGQTAEAVMPELLAVVKTGFGTAEAAEGDSPEAIAQAKSKTAGDVEVDKTMDEDIAAAAKEAVATVIF